MDVNKLNVIQALTSGKDKRERRPKQDQGRSGASGPSGAERAPVRDDDAVSVMGIPPHEMTLNVEKAIHLLLDEVSSLRRQLAESRGHEIYLERHVDEHPNLPVLSRRGFSQRLNQILTRAASAEVDSCFLYFHVFNAETVRTHMGSGAEDALLKLVADVLNREFEGEAVIGSLNNADFGVILPAAGREEGDEKSRRVVDLFTREFTLWEGEAITAKVLHGISVFNGMANAESILAEADRDLIERGKRHGL